MTNTLNTLELERNFLKLVKIIYKNLVENIMVNSEILKAFLLRLGIPPNTLLFNILLAILAIVIRQEKSYKD